MYGSKGRPRGTKNKTLNVKLPCIAGYVSDGKEEPPVPSETNLIDALEILRLTIDRALELDEFGNIYSAERSLLERIGRMVNTIGLRVGEALVKKQIESYKWLKEKTSGKKLTDGKLQTKLNVCMQDEDYAIHRPYLRAYSIKKK